MWPNHLPTHMVFDAMKYAFIVIVLIHSNDNYGPGYACVHILKIRTIDRISRLFTKYDIFSLGALISAYVG